MSRISRFGSFRTSRRFCSYSSRFSRLMGPRPCARTSASSAVWIALARSATISARFFSGRRSGRGGISPFWTRSWICIQRSRTDWSFIWNFKDVISRPPFAELPSWHSAQASTTGRRSAGAISLAPVMEPSRSVSRYAASCFIVFGRPLVCKQTLLARCVATLLIEAYSFTWYLVPPIR